MRTSVSDRAVYIILDTLAKQEEMTFTEVSEIGFGGLADERRLSIALNRMMTDGLVCSRRLHVYAVTEAGRKFLSYRQLEALINE